MNILEGEKGRESKVVEVRAGEVGERELGEVRRVDVGAVGK